MISTAASNLNAPVRLPAGPIELDENIVADATSPKPALFRAAEYVRMSTDHQQYSTDNQRDKIREYAARRGIEIVRTYADEGSQGPKRRREVHHKENSPSKWYLP